MNRVLKYELYDSTRTKVGLIKLHENKNQNFLYGKKIDFSNPPKLIKHDCGHAKRIV
jgi:hypothetical protein